jgi:hypothetical protein
MRLLLLWIIVALVAKGASKAVAPVLPGFVDGPKPHHSAGSHDNIVEQNDWLFNLGVEIAGLDFDVKKYAEEMWRKYVEKGEHWNCIMDATDAGAGFLIEDTKKPPSVASPWQGDLQGKVV